MKQINSNTKSVKSKSPCQSVILTMYDIVKAHGGEIKVETVENNETIFKICLPE